MPCTSCAVQQLGGASKKKSVKKTTKKPVRKTSAKRPVKKTKGKKK
jgi:hypothetical protein